MGTLFSCFPHEIYNTDVVIFETTKLCFVKRNDSPGTVKPVFVVTSVKRPLASVTKNVHLMLTWPVLSSHLPSTDVLFSLYLHLIHLIVLLLMIYVTVFRHFEMSVRYREILLPMHVLEMNKLCLYWFRYMYLPSSAGLLCRIH